MASRDFLIELHRDGKSVTVYVIGADETWCLTPQDEPTDLDGARVWSASGGGMVLRSPDWRQGTWLDRLPTVRERLAAWPGAFPGICRAPVSESDDLPSAFLAFHALRRQRGRAMGQPDSRL